MCDTISHIVLKIWQKYSYHFPSLGSCVIYFNSFYSTFYFYTYYKSHNYFFISSVMQSHYVVLAGSQLSPTFCVCEPSTHGEQKRCQVLMGLELQMVVSSTGCCRQAQLLCKNSQGCAAPGASIHSSVVLFVFIPVVTSFGFKDF